MSLGPGVQDFHQDFTAPFADFEVAVHTAEGPYPFPVSIDGRGYVMDLKQWKHATLEQNRQTSDTSREPGEQSLSTEGVWKRTGTSSTHGAGQEFYDDDESDRSRFYRSAGIDPWERRKVRLLPKAVRVRSSAQTNLRCFRVKDRFLFLDDDTIYATTDPRDTGATWTDQDVFGPDSPASIASITTNGVKVYVAAGGSGIYSFTPGTPGGAVFLAGGTFPATLIVYANGWLVGGAANELKTLDSTGTPTDLWVHRNDDFVWVTGCSAPNAIYLGGNAGDRAEFYRTAAKEDGSELAVPIFAGELPAGETVYTISYYSQLMLIGTSRGLRIATIDNDGGLSIGKVIVDDSGEGVRCFEARGQYAWYGCVNSFDANARGLARADLANSVEETVPVYASDLASTVTASGRTTSVATWIEDTTEYRLFCVSGSGLWAQSDELVDEGTLDLGWLGMGSPERKTLQSVSVSHELLHGTVALHLTNEQGSIEDATSEVQGTYTSGELSRSISGELIDVQLILRRSVEDPTQGPVLRRWTVRVVPAPAAVDEIFVPILLADVVTDLTTEAKYGTDSFSEFRFLKTLENERRVVTYREGQASYLVTVRSVGMEGANDWTRDRRFLNGVLVVRLVTIEGVPPQLPGGSLS